MAQHILLIDDEVALSAAVSLSLRKRGYMVSTVSNGASALEMIATTVVDLVILDVSLGDENGLELLGTLKSRFPNIPVIIFTGWGYQEELWEDARAKGADAYTSKSLAGNQLLMDIHRVLAGRKVGPVAQQCDDPSNKLSSRSAEG